MSAPLAGYTRVSHVGGRRGDSFHSPDDQEHEINGWAARRAERVEMLPPELDGKGSDPNRPILRRAVDGVKAGEYSGVVVAYLSRAGRDLRLMLDLWDEVEAAGGTVYFARENIDGSTPSGRLQRNLLASIAQHELEERREGFARAREGAIEAGCWKQRQTPRGYDRHPKVEGHPLSRRLVKNAQADEVRRAFEDRRDGASFTTLADRLGMTPQGVRMMLKNRVYLGELREGEHVNPKAHEEIVNVELFESVQRAMTRPARRVAEGPALLASLVRCAGCGHVMTRGGNAAVRAYTCAVRHSGARCPEPAAVTLALLDAHVERIALAELQRVAVTASDGKGVERARAALRTAESELAAYLSAVSAADVGAEAFGAGARQRREAVDAARDALRDALAINPAVPMVASGADAWADLNAHERNTVLRGLLRAVVVKRGGGRGSRTPLHERVRVIAHGASLALPVRRGGEASGIAPIALPDLDDPRVLRMPSGENAAQDARSVDEVRRKVALVA